MRALHRANISYIAVLIGCLLACPISIAQNRLPEVVVLATGGTIAGKTPIKEDREYEAGIITVQSLIGDIIDIRDVASVSGRQVANVGSQDMSAGIWFDLVQRISTFYADDGIDGIVITHGTDTIEETAFFLDLIFPSGKPIVLTGAMRPADDVSADGPRNLLNAIQIASSEAAHGRGVVVVLNGKIHDAARITKAHTENLDAFTSVNGGLIGEFINGNPLFYIPAPPRSVGKSAALPTRTFPKVGILYGHVDSDADIVRYYENNGYRGLVLAGVGNGNTNSSTLSALSNSNMVIIRSSRVQSGFVARNVEINDDASGFVASRGLNPVKSRIFLQLLLMNEVAYEDFQPAFDCLSISDYLDCK